MGVEEHTIELAGSPVFFRSAPATGPGPTTLYLHGVPTSADDWAGLLARTGGVAVDLPGFGRSGKGGHLDYSVAGYLRFLENLLAVLGLEQVAVVGHGWGGAFALMLALRRPAEVARLGLIDPVPLLPGFAWPAPVRWWRRPLVGELVMGSASRWALARALRAGCAEPAAWTNAAIDRVWAQFDQGTQRAILRLHRSLDAGDLAELGAGMDAIQAPALVVWGEQDPWLDVGWADAYAARLTGARVDRVAGAGHWPWLEQPAVAERLAAFLSGG